jgi:hypothetical protein
MKDHSKQAMLFTVFSLALIGCASETRTMTGQSSTPPQTAPYLENNRNIPEEAKGSIAGAVANPPAKQ